MLNGFCFPCGSDFYNNTNHMSITIKIVPDKKTKQCNGRKKSELEEIRKQHLQNVFSTSMVIPCLPGVWGTWGPSFSSKPRTRWFAPCGMECSRQHPLSNWSFQPTVHCAVNSITGTKVLHELRVTRTFLLMAPGLGSTWVGKGFPFVQLGLWIVQRAQCLLLKRCFAALCCYFRLSMMSCGTKDGFHELSSWSSEQPSPLCSWSLSLMAALVYVDLLLKNCAPPEIKSIAPF